MCFSKVSRITAATSSSGRNLLKLINVNSICKYATRCNTISTEYVLIRSEYTLRCYSTLLLSDPRPIILIHFIKKSRAEWVVKVGDLQAGAVQGPQCRRTWTQITQTLSSDTSHKLLLTEVPPDHPAIQPRRQFSIQQQTNWTGMNVIARIPGVVGTYV